MTSIIRYWNITYAIICTPTLFKLGFLNYLIRYLNDSGIKLKLSNSRIISLDIIQIISEWKVCSWKYTWVIWWKQFFFTQNQHIFVYVFNYILRSFWHLICENWVINNNRFNYLNILGKFDDGGHLDDVITGSSSQFMQCYLSIS